jgi:predicted glutamine amidotransferase
VAELVRHYPIHSKNVIAHIRKATQGRIALENTHPFQRELWGRYWIFAHNGNLKGFAPVLDGSFVPVGDTDSELAFCYLLQRLRAEFGDAMPLRQPMFDFLAGITREIAAHGEFNFLLSNGNCLYAHCATKLAYIVRQAPFAVAHLKDQDVSVDFSAVTSPDDRVAVIATLPLTDNEAWTTMEAGHPDGFPRGHAGRPGTHRMKTVAGHTARKRFGQNFLVPTASSARSSTPSRRAPATPWSKSVRGWAP